MATFFSRPIMQHSSMTARGHAKLMKILMRQMAIRHRERVLPLHFLPGASAKYGMERRTDKYLAKKYKKWKHQKPLVWSGKTRDTVVGSKVTATQYKSRIYVRNYFPMKDQLRREIEVITPAELKAAAEWFEKMYGDAVNGGLFQSNRDSRGRFQKG